MVEKYRIAVVGPGQYFKKLQTALRTHFELSDVVGLPDEGSAPGSLHERLSSSGTDAVMILSPNQLHAQQVAEVAPLRRPVFVEKPLATTREGLESVVESLKTNPSLYCSDFYPDVRALPILMWCGETTILSNERVIVEGDKGLWMAGRASIGRIQRLDAVLLEGEGQARTFDQREWLWDATHGGVLWDLAYHYATLSHLLLKDSLVFVSAHLGIDPDAPASNPAETCSVLNLSSPPGVQLSFYVGKYHPGKNQRWLRMKGDNGTATMYFSPENRLEVRAGGRACSGTFTGDYYEAVVEAFRTYVGSKLISPHGFQAAETAIMAILSAKKNGVRCDPSVVREMGRPIEQRGGME